MSRWTRPRPREWERASVTAMRVPSCCDRADVLERSVLRRSLLSALFSLVLAAACGRVEEPRAGADTPRPNAPASTGPSRPNAAPSASSTSTPARCIAPWSDTPAPAARAASRCPTSSEPAPKLPNAAVTFTDAPNQPTVTVEVAETSSTRSRGLMYRTELEQDRGMLFSWDAEEPRTFWMHNTCVPLDMLFIAADATIVGILEQVPTLNDESRGVACPAAHVLELNAGWSRSHGVRPGQKLGIAR
jgi:uncharacterized membrane protein (UPF0127 family)